MSIGYKIFNTGLALAAMGAGAFLGSQDNLRPKDISTGAYGNNFAIHDNRNPRHQARYVFSRDENGNRILKEVCFPYDGPGQPPTACRIFTAPDGTPYFSRGPRDGHVNTEDESKRLHGFFDEVVEACKKQGCGL